MNRLYYFLLFLLVSLNIFSSSNIFCDEFTLVWEQRIFKYDDSLNNKYPNGRYSVGNIFFFPSDSSKMLVPYKKTIPDTITSTITVNDSVITVITKIIDTQGHLTIDTVTGEIVSDSTHSSLKPRSTYVNSSGVISFKNDTIIKYLPNYLSDVICYKYLFNGGHIKYLGGSLQSASLEGSMQTANDIRNIGLNSFKKNDTIYKVACRFSLVKAPDIDTTLRVYKLISSKVDEFDFNWEKVYEKKIFNPLKHYQAPDFDSIYSERVGDEWNWRIYGVWSDKVYFEVDGGCHTIIVGKLCKSTDKSIVGNTYNHVNCDGNFWIDTLPRKTLDEEFLYYFYENKHPIVLGAYTYNNLFDTTYYTDYIILVGNKLKTPKIKSYFLREYDKSGKIVDEKTFDESNRHILDSIFRKRHSFRSQNDVNTLKLTPQKELYIYGHFPWLLEKATQKDSITEFRFSFSDFYIAKFNKDLKLVYEKRWNYNGDDSLYNKINEVIPKDGYVYLRGITSPMRGKNAKLEHKIWYFAKFKEPTTSITEPLSLVSSTVYPNPTAAENIATVRLELEDACDLRIVLSDVLGQEIMQIYEGFTDAGTFTKSFTTQHLPKGVYFLKTLIGGQYKIEKIVVND